ncbi:MAG TPA: phosphate ABC transporter permease subunit PstC [Geminicoccaceae bacterium]|nr:phosphate ABC transporter permease subunit PstC [Geminicoccus sp.]HMU52128.1 phosphate ABC transporter permease subunit PstC [Geminicoccaceae bacterium]
MTTVLVILVLASAGWLLGRRRAFAVAGGKPSSLHSRPGHHAWYAALLAAGPALALWAVWLLFEPFVLRWSIESSLPPEVLGQSPEMLGFFMSAVRRIASGLPPTGEVTPAMRRAADYYATFRAYSRLALTVATAALAIVALWLALGRIERDFRARNRVERWVSGLLWLAAAISIATTAGIVFSVLLESLRFFDRYPILDFLFGLEWSPQTAMRADQVGSSGLFGAVPLFAGTLLITVIAMAVAGPLGMLSAIYLSYYASHRFRAWAKPVLEVLAGIPTVVYGFFAALTVAPFIREAGGAIGLGVSSESALAAGLVMGIMIIPFVSSLADDALTAVPVSLRDASYGLGATRAETITQVIVPAALPGIIAGFLLAISRAIGETMIVVMAAGLAANLTANPLEAVTTVTVQIVTLLIGDQEFDSTKTLSAFALGLVLFVVTLMLNIVALYVMKTFREKYD